MKKPITKKLDAEIGAAAGALANLLILAEETDMNFSAPTTQRMDDVAAINQRLLKRQVGDAVAADSHASGGDVYSDERVALEGLEANAWVLRDLLTIAERIVGTDEHGNLMVAVDHYRDQVNVSHQQADNAWRATEKNRGCAS